MGPFALPLDLGLLYGHFSDISGRQAARIVAMVVFMMGNLLIGWLLKDYSTINYISSNEPLGEVSASSFFLRRHQQIYDSRSRWYSQIVIPDIVTLRERLIRTHLIENDMPQLIRGKSLEDSSW